MRGSMMASPLLAFALLASQPLDAAPCSCGPREDFATAFARSAAVFLGEVLSIQDAVPDYNYGVWVTLRVDAQWKGAPSTTLRILTGSSGANCGYDFMEGQRYLVYAETYGQTGDLWTHLCSRTHGYYAGDPDLALLAATPVAAGSWGRMKVRYR